MKEAKRKHASKMKNKKDKDKNDEYKPRFSEVPLDDRLLHNLSIILEEIANDSKNLDNYEEIIQAQKDNPFSSKKRPKISMYDYLKRISSFSMINTSTYIIALMLTDRLCLESSLCITEKNIHRLIFTSILIAIKINEDIYYEMNYYAEIAGISLAELIILEESFLDLIKFNLNIKPEDYQKYIEYINSLDEE